MGHMQDSCRQVNKQMTHDTVHTASASQLFIGNALLTVSRRPSEVSRQHVALLGLIAGDYSLPSASWTRPLSLSLIPLTRPCRQDPSFWKARPFEHVSCAARCLMWVLSRLASWHQSCIKVQEESFIMKAMKSCSFEPLFCA